MSAFTETFGAFAPYMVLLVAGILPNEVWRWMAVWLSRGLDENSAIFEWVRMVSTCLVAGVVAQLLIEPSGALAAVPGPLRLVAGIMAVAGFFISGRRVLAGVLSGGLTIGIGMAAMGG
ncbi:MAG: AzlD domain-containing protein [Beijerinckiaceae bacterium]